MYVYIYNMCVCACMKIETKVNRGTAMESKTPGDNEIVDMCEMSGTSSMGTESDAPDVSVGSPLPDHTSKSKPYC